MTHSDPKLARLAPSTATVRPVRLQFATANPVWCTANVDNASASNEKAPYGITSGDCHHLPPGAAHTQRRFSSYPRGMLAATIKKLAQPAGKLSTPTSSASPANDNEVNRTERALYRKSLRTCERFVTVGALSMAQPYSTGRSSHRARGLS